MCSGAHFDPRQTYEIVPSATDERLSLMSTPQPTARTRVLSLVPRSQSLFKTLRVSKGRMYLSG